MDHPQVNHISLCAGYAGIDIGLSRVVRNLRTVAYCEIEAFACANLVSKMEAGLLDAAPIWTSAKDFPFRKFRGLVDILSGGYPCPPFSAAGKRLGKEDPRHLWPWIADGIRLCRPGLCLFENVEGHVSLGLSTVVSDLEEMGYTVSWGVFSAAEVGAPHQRKRVFILGARDGWVADPALSGLQARVLHDVRTREEQRQGPAPCAHTAGGERVELADPARDGREQGRAKPKGRKGRPKAELRGEDVAHGEREGLEGQPGDEQDGREPGRIDAHEGGSAPSGGVRAWPARPGQQLSLIHI